MNRLSTLNSFRPRSLGLVLVLACAAFSSAGALAADEPPLQGPKINDQSVPGETRRFGSDQQGDRKDRNPGLQHAMFMRAVNSLKGETADVNVRLREDQAQKIDLLDHEYREQMRAFLAKNAQEVKGLIGDLPEKERKRVREGLARGLESAGAPAKPDAKGKRATQRDEQMNDAPADPQKAAAAKTRLKEIHEGAPQSTEAHAKIFGVLNGDQRAAVEATLKKWKDEKATTVESARSKKPEGDAGAARDKIRQKLKNMSPEQRRETLKKIRERRANSSDSGANEPKK